MFLVKVRLQLPAKVNWTLRVLGKRPDGFHELRSWFVAVDICDTLEAVPAECSSLSVTGPFGEGLNEVDENLVLKAERKWRESGGDAPPISWMLEKNIPIGGGLGGGSSNAAGALWLLERSATCTVGNDKLVDLAASLGSDVPFFFSGQDAELRGGKGEELLKRVPSPDAWLVFVCPPVEVSTAKVYTNLGASGLIAENAPTAEVDRSIFPAVPGPNDLESTACDVYPQLAEISRKLAAVADSQDLPRFYLSGSGGCFFTVCSDAPTAHDLARVVSSLEADILVARTHSGAVLPLLSS